MENSNGGNTNVGSIGNSIKNERSSIEEDIERLKLCSTNQCHICGRYEREECMLERNRCEQHILSDYKKLQEEFKQVDHECDRLEKIDFEKDMKIKELQKENEELRESNKKLYEIGQEMCKQDKYTRENYISVQKVKDKIEELKEEIEQLRIERNVTYDSGIYRNQIKIDILQKLLESEE